MKFKSLKNKKKVIISSLLALFTVTIVGFSNSYQVKAEDDVQQYAMGCIPDDEETLKSLQADDLPMAVSESLPTSVDLESKMPSPGNQGQQGSCTAWAVAYAAKSYQENQEHSWVTSSWSTKTEFSPAFLYNQINGGVDKGSNISVAMKTIKEKGICSLYDMPYNQNDYLTQPNTYQNERASNFKGAGYHTVKGTEAVKSELADGNPVVISIPVYGDFDDLDANNPIYDKIEGKSRGYHAICLIGYDDSKKAFKLINSWGDSGNWGVKGSYYNKYGYGYISYDLFEQSNVSNGWGYVMTDAVQHYKSNPYEVKALKSIGVYSDTELKTKVKTISAGTSLKVKSYIAASNGNPPVLRVEDGYITAKTDMTEKTSEYPVIYDGPCSLTEINVYELGKAIKGSKLRITYVSGCAKGENALGIVGRSLNGWEWLESEDHISLLSYGVGVESVIEISYNNLVKFAELEKFDLRSIIFRNWGLKKNTNIKIELITPNVTENVTEVYNGNIKNTYADISPYELGKNINGAKIRVTLTASSNDKSIAAGVAGKTKGDFDWINHKNFLYGKQKGYESVYTFSYNDFVKYFGIGDDVACFVFKGYSIDSLTNLKVELITPVKNEKTTVLFNGKLNYTQFTPTQLGKYISGSKIRITYTPLKKGSSYEVLGISGQIKNPWKWVQNQHGLLSKGIGRESVYTFNYNDLIKYIGTGDNLDWFVFQDWGIRSPVKIELITPA